MRIIPFLEEAAVLEDALASCYGALAAAAPGEDIPGKFKRLEAEEANHARIIRSGKTYELKAPAVFGDSQADLAEIRSGVASARSVFEDVRGGRFLLREGVARLRELEARFEKVHLDTLVSFKDESLRDLFRRLSRDDRRHVDVLDEILKSLP